MDEGFFGSSTNFQGAVAQVHKDYQIGTKLRDEDNQSIIYEDEASIN